MFTEVEAKIKGKHKSFELLALNSYTSQRGRMSVVF